MAGGTELEVMAGTEAEVVSQGQRQGRAVMCSSPGCDLALAWPQETQHLKGEGRLPGFIDTVTYSPCMPHWTLCTCRCTHVAPSSIGTTARSKDPCTSAPPLSLQ